MTHLSDYSYISRESVEILILIWALYHFYRTERFESFYWANIQSFKPKTATAYLLMTSLVLMIVYDGIAAYIKYQEGFYVNPTTGIISQRPAAEYTRSYDVELLTIADSVLNVSWSLKSSSLFMLIATFNHVSLSRFNIKFMSTTEFKICRLYSLVSILLYPIMEWSFSYNELLSTIMPQFVYHVECAVIVVLLQLTNFRIRLLHDSSTQSEKIAERLTWFIHLNDLLSIIVFFDFIGLFIINVDIVAGQTIYHNKFWTDLLTGIFSFGFDFAYPIVIIILFPFQKESTKIIDQAEMTHVIPTARKFGDPTVVIMNPIHETVANNTPSQTQSHSGESNDDDEVRIH